MCTMGLKSYFAIFSLLILNNIENTLAESTEDLKCGTSALDDFHAVQKFFKPNYENVVLILAADLKFVNLLLKWTTDYNKISLASKELKHLEQYFDAYVDSKTGMLYYNLALNHTELMSRYLAKQLVDGSKNVKIVLLFEELPRPYSRKKITAQNEMINVIEYASSLISNVDKFLDNIGAEIYYDSDFDNYPGSYIEQQYVNSNDIKFLNSVTGTSSKVKKIIAKIRSKIHYVQGCLYPNEFNEHLKSNIVFTNKKMSNDFNYMSNDCQNPINSLAQSINNYLDKDRFEKVQDDLANQILSHFKAMEDRSTVADIVNFYEQIKNVLSILPNESIVNSKSSNKPIYSKTFHEGLMKIVQDYKIQLSENVKFDLVQKLEILYFLEKDLFVNTNFSTSSLKAIFQENKLWYSEFIKDNLNTSVISEKKFSYWLTKSWGNYGFSTSSHNAEIKKKIMDTAKHFINTANKQEPSCSFVNNILKLTMMGDVIRTLNLELSLEKCEAKHKSKVKQIILFATERIYIDSDIIRIGDELQVVIISPEWEIVGKRKIILDGISPAPYQNRKAKNGDQNGYKNGARGRAGLPGGPPGSFYGIGELFIREENLLISVNGGNGSNGQDGGDGAQGKKPRNYELFDPLPEKYVPFLNKWYERYNIERRRLNMTGELSFGGKGGDGGVGGKGNAKGDVQIIGLKGATKIKLVAQPGSNGLDGIGGKGKNGPNADTTILILKREGNKFVPEYIEAQYSTGKHSLPSANGLNGVSTLKQQRLKEAKISQEFSLLINQYKNFVLTCFINEQDTSKRIHLNKIYNLISSDSNVASTYDLMAFANELLLLENQYFHFKNKKDFTPYYQDLLKRIKNYKGTLVDAEKLSVYRNIIDDLEKRVTRKISHIEFFEVTNIVILNLNEHQLNYKTVLNQVEKFSRIVNSVSTLQNFKNNIDSAVQIAQRAINNNITVELESLGELTDRNIESLIIETIQLKKNLEHNKKELEEKQAEMKRMVIYKALFELLQLSIQCLSLAVPELAIVGGIAGGILSTAKPYIFDEDKHKPKLLAIPKSVKTGLETINLINEGYVDSWTSVLNSHIDYVEQVKLDTLDHDEIQELNEIKNLLQNIKSETASSHDWKNPFEKEINVMDEQKKIRVGGTINKVLDRLITLSKAALIKGESWAHPQVDDSVIDEVEDAINKTQNDLLKLDDYEKNIYSFLTPVLDSVHEVASGKDIIIQNQNLQLLQWKILSKVETMKDNLEKASQGFESERGLKNVLERIKDTFKTMFGIYTEIQNKNNTIDIATFITDTALVGYSGSLPVYYQSSFNKLSIILTKAKLSQLSNQLLYNYRKTIESLKLFAFPCGKFYFEKLNLDLTNVADLKEATLTAISIIDDISQQITSRAVLPKRHYDDFYQKPFYIWDHISHKEYIIKLLNGEKIKLNASITNKFNYDAIKFQNINLRFSSNDHILRSNVERSIKDCDIKLIHSGKSLYKYRGNIYAINTAPTKFYTNWRISDSVDENEFLLSPYTEWTFQIKRENDCNLNKYINDKLNLELVGKGTYIQLYDNICQIDVEKYFEKVDFKQ